ncbi:MAG: beta-propeller fold lactonase family protein [Acidimicrobiales bacterium]|jgi:6-phosphogluconolactonase (cycloisomerase 2 family)
MRRLVRLAVGAGAVLGLSAWVAPVAVGAERLHRGPIFEEGADHVVFVQTDNTAGNQVVAYDRADDGSLTLADTYDTGGLGGVLNGSAVDHLASQGSLTYDQRNALLYAVNAGSDTVSVFSVRGGQLTLLGATGTDPGTVDALASVNGRFLYVQSRGNGIVDEFEVNANGTLTGVGPVTVAGAVGGEGIVAFQTGTRQRRILLPGLIR